MLLQQNIIFQAQVAENENLLMENWIIPKMLALGCV